MKPPTFAPLFQRLIDDPDTAFRALQDDPAAFEQALIDQDRGALVAYDAIPLGGSVGAMLFDADGRRVSVAGPGWLPDTASFDNLAPDRTDERLFYVGGMDGTALPAICATVARALGWKLPAAVRDAAALHPQGRIVLIAGGGAAGQSLAAACAIFGLTDLQRRVVTAVVRHGSGRRAADALGLAYSTVRETLANAAQRMGVPNLPALVHAVVAAAFGILPAQGDSGAILSDMLPVTQRQATIMVLVSAGMTREEIARALDRSVSVVRKELEVVHATLGVASAAELARLVVEVRALRLFTASTNSDLGFVDPVAEPTRLTPRADGTGPIAWSDYGPRSGRPVLLVHSNWCCRAVPRPLLAALQRAGFRPIAIDRPGFGATSLGRSSITDPFGQAIDDTRAILDLLGIGRIPVIARCGAQFVVELHHAAPDRVGPVILVSPTPATSEEGLRHGIVGVVKEAFWRNPRLIEFFFRIISAQITIERTEALTRAIVRGCAVDTRLCDDRDFIRDRLRAIRPLSTGNMAGAVHEEYVISHATLVPRPVSAADWTVIQGKADTHNSYTEVHGYWSGILPHSRFVAVTDGGRFMTTSHPDLIVEALCGAQHAEAPRPRPRSPRDDDGTRHCDRTHD